MRVEINITDNDIAHAERLLLPEGRTFDAERRAFINRFDTLDLQAVPGSGKTTVLLAKLVILERYLPFSNGSGILVISHTNTAVDEIKKKIGKQCQRLFAYPNYIGTIQSFVDRFLAIPAYVARFGKRPTRIDNEIFDVAVAGYYRCLPAKCPAKAWLDNKSDAVAFLKRIRFDDQFNLTDGIGGAVALKKASASETYKTLARMKMDIFGRGYLHFEDAYFLAAIHLSKRKAAKALMQERFSYVFVDEMQDMGKHQHDLLEELFFDGGKCQCGYQRIGDRNQSIYDNNDFDEKSAWQARGIVLSLANSYRLSIPIATVVNFFALDNADGFQINGLSEVNIKPHIIIFDDASVCTVVHKFSSILRNLIDEGRIPESGENIFKAVAWNSEWNAEDKGRTGSKFRLVDYCPAFQKARQKSRIDHNCLEDYLRHYDRKNKTLGAVQKSILNFILKVLRLEDANNPESGSHFTSNSLLKFLREKHAVFYEQFKLCLYQWTLYSIRGDITDVVEEIRETIPKLLQIFGKDVNKSREFIDQPAETAALADTTQQSFSNIVNIHGFDIEIATVHSVKGQTHTATLYMETYFHQDGHGVAAKSYESQRLSRQFLMEGLVGSERKRVKQSARMVYVGFSRPTHLLCFAVHKDRFHQYLSGLDTTVWEIIKIYGQDECVA
ncbi:MAG: UvrD-helicase domain-containing protein [Nitrospiraceae bacterium]|nr:UvrD-helicase domain-containing protein [Nitrospiraceae bacterium]